MKLVILKNSLREGLLAVERATAENANLPILKNVLIKTFNNKIQFFTTNLEIAVSKQISGKIVEEGSVTVPLHTLLTITNNTTSERINLETNRSTLVFKTDNYEATIQGLPEEEFPLIPKIENTKNHITFDADRFKEVILKVVNTIQLSEIRPEISGMLFDFQMTYVKLVGTDSFRLAENTISDKEFTTTFQRGFKVVIPLKTVQEVLRTLGSGSVSLFFDPNQVLFKNDDLEIISRLIDGNYPDYEPITPKSFETELVIEREHLMNAVKLVSTFSGKVNEIRLQLKEGKKIVEVYSVNQSLGENKYLVPVKAKGDACEVSFNWRYLMDGLKNFNDTEFFFGLNGSHRAAMLKSQANASYFYILMPINSQ
ncbi:MAG: DNA polymerase III subunit beta [Patescibacteria group bacterium]|nr:DNA polymerase III subunit beta [Patescibacteria group bacterium]